MQLGYLMVFLPLLGAILSGFFGKIIGVRNSEIITSFFVSISFNIRFPLTHIIFWITLRLCDFVLTKCSRFSSSPFFLFSLPLSNDVLLSLHVCPWCWWSRTLHIHDPRLDSVLGGRDFCLPHVPLLLGSYGPWGRPGDRTIIDPGFPVKTFGRPATTTTTTVSIQKNKFYDP